jgi:hypothetical protein
MEHVIFRCALCQRPTPSVTKTEHGLPLVPDSLVSRRNDKGEWMLVCAETCESVPYVQGRIEALRADD